MIDGIVSSSAETIETNTVKLTFQVSPEKFEEGLRYSYNKNKPSINIQGFRKGKVPRVMVERLYGKTFFYSDAVDYVFDNVYTKVLREHKLNPVQNPKVDVKEVSDETGVAFELEMVVEPLVRVSDYLGITYEPFDQTVADDEIERAIDRDKEKNARVITVEDRPAQKDDVVLIDFSGTVGGEPFEGGEAEDFELLLGSGSFIDDFEDQIAGMVIDDEKQIEVTFPEEYPLMPALAGKTALFDVTLKEIRIKEYPELDDDFAQDISDFETFAEYREDIVKKISENKVKFAEARNQESIVKKLIETIKGEIPQVMFDSMSERIYEEYKQNITNRGLDYESYLQYSGDNDERVRKSAKEDADLRIRSRLALTAVAEQENITVSDEELEDEIKTMAENYGIDKSRLDSAIGENERERLRNDVRVQKALKTVVDAAVIIEADDRTDAPPAEMEKEEE